MIWQWFILMTSVFAITWLLGGLLIFKKDRTKSIKLFQWLLPLIGNIAILIFIALMWIELDRPPMRTMAETRLWYSFFVAWITWFVFLKTDSKPMYILGYVMALVFLIVDIIHPEYQSKNLMPALQSPWFIPHVVVYMISYAVLGAACVSAIIGRFGFRKNPNSLSDSIDLSMKLVYPGFALLTLGMLMGAIWAKIAWGNYWSWDPKETWACLTWLFYMLLIHLQYSHPKRHKLLSNLLVLSFLVLVITWMGIRYLPSAMSSVHVYGG